MLTGIGIKYLFFHLIFISTSTKKLFHSMLAVYAILVALLYGNRGCHMRILTVSHENFIRLHGFGNIAWLADRTGCWVENPSCNFSVSFSRFS